LVLIVVAWRYKLYWSNLLFLYFINDFIAASGAASWRTKGEFCKLFNVLFSSAESICNFQVRNNYALLSSKNATEKLNQKHM
jgi:hypothetical protein